MKKINHRTAKRNMGSLTDNLLDLAISQAGKAIESDPAQKQRAMDMMVTMGTDATKKIVSNNMGILITGLCIFGLSMAASNYVMVYVLNGRK